MENEFEEYTGPVISPEEFEEYSGEVLSAPPPKETTRDYQSREMVAQEEGEKGVAGLPPVHPEMFDGMSPEDEEIFREAYSKHPNSTKDWLGNVEYNGKPLPKTGMNRAIEGVGRAAKTALNPLGSAMEIVSDTPLSESVAGGLYTGVREMAVGKLNENEVINESIPEGVGGAVLRAGKNAIMGPVGVAMDLLPSGTTEAVDKALPKYQPKDAGDEFVSTMASVVPGALVGNKAGSAITAVKAIPAMFRKFAAGLATSGGGGLSMDVDSKTMVTGPESEFYTVWGGISLDENGDYNEELLKKRMNLLADAYLVGRPIEKGIDMVRPVAEFLNEAMLQPAKKFFDASKREKNIAKEMADTLIGFKPGMTADEQAAQYKKLVETVREFDTAIETGNLNQFGIDEVKVKRDSMAAYVDGIDPSDPLLSEKKATAHGMRTNMRGRGAPELEARLGEAPRAMEKLANQTEEVFGGTKAMESSKETIQTLGRKPVDEAFDNVSQASKKIDDVKLDQENLLRDDPLSKTINDSTTDAVDINPTDKLDKTVDDMTRKIWESSEADTGVKNAKYKSIPATATINEKALDEQLALVDDILSPQAKKSLAKIRGNQKAFNEGMDITQGVGEELGSTQTTFKDLDTWANTVLSDEISRNAKDSPNVAGMLRGLRRHINKDQLDYLADNSPHLDVQDAAKEARRYFRDEYAPKWRQGALEDLQDIGRDNMYSNREKNFMVESRKKLKATLDDPDAREYTDGIIDVVGPEKGSDYVIGQVAADAQRLLNANKKITAEEWAGFSKKLEKWVPIIKRTDGGKARYESLLTKLKDQTISIEDRMKELETLESLAAGIEEETLGNKLKPFFNKKGKSYEPTGSSGDVVFEEVFNKATKTGDMSGLKNVKEALTRGRNTGNLGVKAAYGRWINKMAFDSARSASDSPVINKDVFKNSKEKAIAVGKEIFGEDDPIIHATEQLWDMAGKTALSETQRALPLHDINQIAKNMRGAVDLALTWVFGTLNRWGARLRAASGKAITALDRNTEIKMIMDNLYANPDAFANALEKVVKEQGGKFKKEDSALIRDILLKGIIYQDKDTDEQTKEAFGKK